MKKKKKNKQRKKIVIALSVDEVNTLKQLVRRGEKSARAITRARILLLSNSGKTNTEIIAALGCVQFTVTDVRKRYKARGSIDAVLHDAPRPGQPKKITEAHEAFVVATACTSAPEGHSHWTLNALKDKLIATYNDLQSVSHERIRQMLLHAALKPWREKNVVHAESHTTLSRAHG
jgi:transposase